MKQFVLVKNIVTTGYDINTMNDGSISFVKKGSIIPVSDFTDYSGEFNVAVKEGEYMNILPFHTNKFTYNISTPKKATAYKAEVILSSGLYGKGVYSIIITKKGVPFNERNKWTVSTYLNVNSAGNYAQNVGEKLVKAINALNFVKATYSSNKITIDGVEKGVDYKVIFTDAFDSAQPETIKETNAEKAQNDVASIVDLYNKCAADRGINYTYEDAKIYPNLPFNPLKGSDNEDNGFYVFNIRFAEPRIVKTTDEVINQMVHIAVSASNSTVITAIENVFKTLGVNNFTDANVAQTSEEDESPAVD